LISVDNKYFFVPFCYCYKNLSPHAVTSTNDKSDNTANSDINICCSFVSALEFFVCHFFVDFRCSFTILLYSRLLLEGNKEYNIKMLVVVAMVVAAATAKTNKHYF